MSHFNILPEPLRPFGVAEAIISGKARKKDATAEEDRAAKRRRIELQAERYLRGEPLFISSATLRDPFKAPWLNTRASRSHGRSNGKEVRKTNLVDEGHQPRETRTKLKKKEVVASKTEKKTSIEDRGLYVDNPRAIVNSPSKPAKDPEEKAFNPGSASKFTKKWLRRQSSMSRGSSPVPDQYVDEIEDDVTPITRSPTANRRTTVPAVEPPRSRPADQLVRNHDQQASPNAVEGPARKKRKLIDGETNVTSPVANGSQGLQFRRGKRTSKDKSSMAGRTSVVTAAQMRTPLDTTTEPIAERAPTVTSASTELSAAPVAADGRSPKTTDSMNQQQTNTDTSSVHTNPPVPADIVVPSISAAPSIHTDWAEGTTNTRSIPPEHQIEISEPGQPTAEPPTISHEPTADYIEEPSMAEDTYAAAVPALCTQAAFEQAESALDDVFATPVSVLPPAVTIAEQEKTADRDGRSSFPSPPGPAKRTVTLLDTPGLERMAAEIAFDTTVKRPNFTEPQSILIKNTPIAPPVLQFNRSFPPTEGTPRPFTVSRKSILANTPLVSDTPRVPTTVLRKDSTLNNTLVTAPSAPPSASMPEHQPSFDFDMDLDSCLHDAVGLLGTGSLEDEVKGVMKSMGRGIVSGS